jgi:hypothetical protein
MVNNGINLYYLTCHKIMTMETARKLFLLYFFFRMTGLMNAQTLLQDLPVLNDPSTTFLQSTYDRAGLNDDHISPVFPYYYDVIPQGKVNNPNGTATSRKEYVICHVAGPAVVERFWMVPVPVYFNARFRFYFDGESTPRINKTFNDFFFIQTAPFVKPLVQNLYESSGGFWSYIKLPVAKSLIVTIDTAAIFSQFNIRQLPKDSIVQSWTAAQNNSFLINEFNKSGQYPKNNLAQTVKDSAFAILLPGQTQQLFSKSGQYVIDAVKMTLPLNYSHAVFVKDKGNFHKGTSQFTMNINGNANSVLLIKRSNKANHLIFDFNTLAENAVVKVDNQPAGTWQNRNYRTYRYWKDDTFIVPKILYQGKTKITLQFQYSGGEPWNEYYYKISCDGVITDSVDVDVSASETAHNYSVTALQSNLYEELSNRYETPADLKAGNKLVLDSIYIKIYFDGENTPSVDAPVGLFFATGVNDAVYMRSLPCGILSDEAYNYFSMPFWQNARIEIENKSHFTMPFVLLKVLTSPNTYAKQNTGYFKTMYNKAVKSASDPTDYLVGDFTGNGKYVGTVIEAFQNDDAVFCWLEGDDRVYIDDAQTPAYQGTGTEDYFNSTFYFYLDEYSQPLNGMTNSDEHYHKSMYRFHLPDYIGFTRHLRFQIEHGDYDNKFGNYQSLAFAYVQPSQSLLTDSIDVGKSNSEQLHQYTISGNKIFILKTSTFEGEKYTQSLTEDGYSIRDSVEFNVSIYPSNKGVRLLRRFDYSIKDQYSKVYVDDSLVGDWLNAGFNSVSQFREEFFVIPAKYTSNKSSLKIKLVNQQPNANWTDLFYKVYSIRDSTILSSFLPTRSHQGVRIFPTITNNKVHIEVLNENVTGFSVYSSSGEYIKHFERGKGQLQTEIDLAGLSAGTYYISILQKESVIQTEKIVLTH